MRSTQLVKERPLLAKLPIIHARYWPGAGVEGLQIKGGIQ